MLYKEIEQRFASLDVENISGERKLILQEMIEFIQSRKNKTVQLNFICTHNSRRSQFAQILAQAMAFRYGLMNVQCFSGGTEVTALYPKVAETLSDFGFKVEKEKAEQNPVYKISYSEKANALECFSKKFNNPINPSEHFAAVMTCSHADENCPFISGAEKRIPLNYEDPKAFDNSAFQAEKYLDTCLLIATEMKYVFEQV